MEHYTPEGHLPSVGDEYHATCGCVWTWRQGAPAAKRRPVPGWVKTKDCDAPAEDNYCENEACCSERGHDGKCDERAAL